MMEQNCVYEVTPGDYYFASILSPIKKAQIKRFIYIVNYHDDTVFNKVLQISS